ncbi:MAG: SCO family protein [Arenimonas sp.]
MHTRRQYGFASRSTLLVMVAALAGGLGLYAAQHFFAAPAPTPEAAGEQLRAVRLIAPRQLPEYRLALSDGSVASPATLRGHWTVVFLGFTHCPDVCPTTLAELAKAQKQWQQLPAAIRPRLLFVSADPERDDPAKVGEYAHYFHAQTLAASADPAQLAGFAQALGLVYMKVPTANGDYTIDHSATLVLIDPQGRQAGLIRPPLDANAIAADLRVLAERKR